MEDSSNIVLSIFQKKRFSESQKESKDIAFPRSPFTQRLSRECLKETLKPP